MKPWNIFQLTLHPLPSADESERKGRSLGPQTSSSSSREQPSWKEMPTAYLHFRKQTQPVVEKHWQSPRETSGVKTTTFRQTFSVFVDLGSLAFLEPCFCAVQESGSGLLLIALLTKSNASLQKPHAWRQRGRRARSQCMQALLVQLLSGPTLTFLRFSLSFLCKSKNCNSQ